MRFGPRIFFRLERETGEPTIGSSWYRTHKHRIRMVGTRRGRGPAIGMLRLRRPGLTIYVPHISYREMKARSRAWFKKEGSNG